jgi:hypothetical protein
MNDERVFHLLKEINPVADPDGLDSPVALGDFETQGGAMATIERTEFDQTDAAPSQGTSGRKGVMIAVAAAAAVLIVGIGAWALIQSDETKLAASPESIGEAMVAALDSHDAEAAVGLLAPDATVNIFSAGTSEEFRDLFGWFEALDWRFDYQACSSTPTGEVTCTVLQQNKWTAADGTDPVNAELRLDVADGQVTAIVAYDQGPAWRAVFEDYFDFVDDNHPADVERMWLISASGQNTGPRLTEDAIALFDRYSAEYTASQN